MAFGDHFDRSSWKLYQNFLETQHAVIPKEVSENVNESAIRDWGAGDPDQNLNKQTNKHASAARGEETNENW